MLMMSKGFCTSSLLILCLAVMKNEALCTVAASPISANSLTVTGVYLLQAWSDRFCCGSQLLARLIKTYSLSIDLVDSSKYLTLSYIHFTKHLLTDSNNLQATHETDQLAMQFKVHALRHQCRQDCRIGGGSSICAIVAFHAHCLMAAARCCDDEPKSA